MSQADHDPHDNPDEPEFKAGGEVVGVDEFNAFVTDALRQSGAADRAMPGAVTFSATYWLPDAPLCPAEVTLNTLNKVDLNAGGTYAAPEISIRQFADIYDGIYRPSAKETTTFTLESTENSVIGTLSTREETDARVEQTAYSALINKALYGEPPVAKVDDARGEELDSIRAVFPVVERPGDIEPSQDAITHQFRIAQMISPDNEVFLEEAA